MYFENVSVISETVYCKCGMNMGLPVAAECKNKQKALRNFLYEYNKSEREREVSALRLRRVK
jgi:hypothetical protein